MENFEKIDDFIVLRYCWRFLSDVFLFEYRNCFLRDCWEILLGVRSDLLKKGF